MGDPADPPRGRLAEALQARRDTLERLRGRGIEPFALRFDKDADAAELHRRFAGLDPDQDTGRRVAVAGRIVLLRGHGSLVFATLRDGSGDLQLFLERKTMGEGFGLVGDLDLGDIVGAEGTVVTTHRGELSVKVDRLTLLTKALRPLPEKWRGLQDPEARVRRRYLELASNPESRRMVFARAATLKAIRAVLDARGFVEVETPALQTLSGGAVARPFVTHHEALDIPLYLRIAPELYLKRLLVGGVERLYEIGRNFRNEGISTKYNPEFTMLEVYQAYADYLEMMDLVEELLRAAARAVNGSLKLVHRDETVDLEVPFPRVRLDELVSEAAGAPLSLQDGVGLRRAAAEHGVPVEPEASPGRILQELYEKLVEPNLLAPTWVMDIPREASPLARTHRSTPGFTEHADLVFGGIELAPVYSELTDPEEQRARFQLQRAAREAGDEEAHPMDEDFLEALEHGMPPAGGFGLGIDRTLIVLTDAASIRDVILFPHVRPEKGPAPADS